MSVAPEAAAGAERWLDGAAIDQSAVLFVIGLGDGQLLTALASRGWRGRVIALEPAGSSPLTPSADLTILTGPEYAGLDHAVMAIDQGVVVPEPGRDIDGDPHGAMPDIGADER